MSDILGYRLSCAVHAGDIDGVERILREPGGIDKARSGIRYEKIVYPVLFFATAYHPKRVFRNDVNFTCDDVTGPSNNRIECARMLLENGVDINQQNTPFEDLTDEERYTESLDQTALYIASALGDVQLVRFFIDAKADPNICNDENISPLHVACRFGFEEIIRLLLQHGANPNTRSVEFGKTPLFELRTGDEESALRIVSDFVRHGANLNQKNNKGMTLALYTLSERKYAVEKALLLRGAEIPDINAPLEIPLRDYEIRIYQERLNTIIDELQGRDNIKKQYEAWVSQMAGQRIKAIRGCAPLSFMQFMHIHDALFHQM